jgi:CDP-paratose 2-epimerase
MSAPICLVTGRPVSSAPRSAVPFVARLQVHGIDNNQRAVFFGPAADTRWNQRRLERTLTGFHHHDVDVRDRQAIADTVRTVRPMLIVHAAAQPSHDRAAEIPIDDFETNAVGTLNLLEAARASCKESPFVFMSTNKVYGDLPNALPLVELETRWEIDPEHPLANGITEEMSIDRSVRPSTSKRPTFWSESGRYYGMPTCCLRWLRHRTDHSGVELHGFPAIW